MPIPEFVNERVAVQARFTADGAALPTAFTWRERTYLVAEWGRRWSEQVDGAGWQCYLVRTPANETFDLRYAPAEGHWLLARAWQKGQAG